MTLLNNEPQMGKNYWIAILLSLLVLISYPFFVKMLGSRNTQSFQEIRETYEEEAHEEAAEETGKLPQAPVEREEFLSPPQGPFLEEPAKPAVVYFGNDVLEIEFSTLGGTLTRLVYTGDQGPRGAESTVLFEGNPLRPGILGLRIAEDEADLSSTIFSLTRRGQNNNVFEFAFEKPNEYRVTKKFTVGEREPVIFLEIDFENLADRPRHVPLELTYGTDYEIEEQVAAHSIEAVVRAEKIKSANIGKLKKKGFSVSGDILWAGATTKYFTLLVNPDWKVLAVRSKADEKTISASLRMDPLSILAGQKTIQNVLVYAGPKRYEVLKRFEMGFEDILSKGFFGLFKVWLLAALKFFYRYTHNYGWSILLLTCIIKLIFTPLTHMSYESMKKMQAVQPKMKALQERHKKDPAKLNKEMMELYKRNKVNPMGGCLPMLLQIPIFIAFFQVLGDAIELKGAGFIWWIHDLSGPDRLFTFPFSIPFIGDSFNLLPLLMIGSMFWQQKLTPQAGSTPEQTKMMTFLPLIFGVFFYRMPSGLVLYWFVNNVLSIIHQVFVKRAAVVLHHEDAD